MFHFGAAAAAALLVSLGLYLGARRIAGVPTPHAPAGVPTPGAPAGVVDTARGEPESLDYL